MAWTATAGETWQNLLDEITLAYSERRQAIGQSAYTASDGKDVQAASYWTTLQNWLEDNCDSYVDHTATIQGASSIPMFTVSSWRSAASLGSGFRRKVNIGDGFSYGTMQAGDIIGPWIFEDLQKGFGALQRTVVSPSMISSQYRWASGGSDVDCDTARTNAASLWAAASWIDTSIFHGYSVGRRTFTLMSYQFQNTRQRATWEWSSTSTPVTHTDEIWAPASNYLWPYGSTSSLLVDLDGYGFTQLGYNRLYGSSPFTLGDISTAPMDCSPALSCPVSDATEGVSVYLLAIVRVWSFTNA